MRVNGQALGIALSAAIVAIRMPVHLAGISGPPTAVAQNVALAGSIHDAFVVAAGICCIGVVASLVRGSAGHHADQLAGHPVAVASGGGRG